MNICILFPPFDEKTHRKKDPWQIPFHLSKLGHKVEILAYLKNNLERTASNTNGIKVVRVKPNLLHLLLYLLKNSTHIDCIIGYFSKYSTLLSAILFKLAKKNGIFIIKMDTDGSYALPGESIIYLLYRYLLHLLYPYFIDFLIVESPQAKKRIIKRFWWLKSKIIILPNGINVNEFRKLSKKIRSNPRPKKKRKIILFVGDVIPRKGVDLLIKAFSRVHKDFPNYRVRIVGATKINPSYTHYLKRLILLEGLNKKVAFLGRVSEKQLLKEYINADIFVFPSRAESFGIALVEAAYFGKPIVSSNVGAAEFILENGKAGLIFRKNNLDEFVTKLKLVMKKNKLRKTLAKRIAVRCKKLFDWNKIVKRLNLYIEKCRHKKCRL